MVARRYARILATAFTGLLVVVTGCRSTAEDRIRVLEAERAAASQDGERLREELTQARSKQLAAEAQSERQEALLRTLRKELESRQRDQTGTAEPTVDLARRFRGSGVSVQDRGDGVSAIILASDLTFSSGRADLSKKAMTTLGRLAKVLKETSGIDEVRVEGHTDSDPIRKSGWKSNEALSLARAENVRRYLVARGVQTSLLKVEGLGAARPVAGNDTKANKARNRRVEIIVSTSG
ncbi:MAG: flagellar motor protein MotB [Planctomycetota bacterium]